MRYPIPLRAPALAALGLLMISTGAFASRHEPLHATDSRKASAGVPVGSLTVGAPAKAAVRLDISPQVDSTRREVWLALPSPGVGPTQSSGMVSVRNRSHVSADVWVTLNDDSTPWVFVGTVPPRYVGKLRAQRGLNYVIAAEDAGDYDGYWNWGPRAFILRGKFTWTLLD